MSFHAVAAMLGWTGTALLLLGYGLVSVGRIRGDGATFQLLNVGGSSGLGVAAVSGRVWSAATLNAIWIAIGLVVLLRIAARTRGNHASAGSSSGSCG